MLPPDSARAAVLLSIWILTVFVGASSGCSGCAPNSTMMTPLSVNETTTFVPPTHSSYLYQGCKVEGETLTQSSGTIRSPNYPLNYDNDHECEYHIRAPEGRVVELHVDDLLLEETADADCKYDYIEFFDVRDAGSSELDVICTNGSRHFYDHRYAPRTTFKSSGTDMIVRFISDHSNTNRGFQLTYTDTTPECGGTISGLTSGWISTKDQGPEWSDQYKNNAFCTWKITVEPNLRIHLTFCEFEFEKCPNDHLTIAGDDGVVLCGETLPEPFESSGNELTLTMVTDGSVRRGGFKARFTTINTQITHQEARTENAGEIAFPSISSQQYPENSNCEWTITVEAGRRIVVSFTEFDLETSAECTKDFLEIRNGGYLESPLLWKSCSSAQEIPPIVSDSHQLYIRFVSDGDEQSWGFSLEYTSEPGCGGNLTTHGIIQSPNYPNDVQLRGNCTWTAVDLPQHHWMSVAFLDYDIGGPRPHYRCTEGAYLWLERQWDPRTYNPGRPVCGTDIAHYKIGRHDTLRFFSNGTCGRGFQLKYAMDCNGLIRADQGNLSSPFFPNPHGLATNCSWTIIPQSTYHYYNAMSTLFTVNLTAVRLPDCQTQGLRIKDGSYNSTGSLICGDGAVPRSMVFLSRSFNVQYASGPTTVNQGFTLAWDRAECRFQLGGSSGSFASPLYPVSVPPNTHCEWSPTMNHRTTGYRLTITFNVSWPDCANSPLKVIDGYYWRPVCANSTVFSGASISRIVLRTSYSQSDVAFQANFIQDCGGEVNADRRGTLYISRNGASHSHTCTWTLKTNHTDKYVYFNLNSLRYGNATTCEEQSLTIETFTNSSSVQRMCGNQLPRSMIVSGPQLRITFTVGTHVGNFGFSGSYYTNDPPCGGVYTAETGTIFSPSYPNNYPNNKRCTWNIEVPFGKIVVLNITEMSLASRYCQDRLEVRVENENTRRLCISTNQSQIIRADTQMTLVFVSNSYYSSRGFIATYRIVDGCGGVISGPSGSLSLPSNRTVGDNCHWRMQAPEGKVIKLIITSYDSGQCMNSSSGLVVSSLGLPVHVLPEEWIPNSLIWRENVFNLSYVNIQESSHFEARAVQVVNTSLCGSVMSDKMGLFMTPSNTSHCPGEGPIEWTIQAEQNFKITIQFLEFVWRIGRWDRQDACSQRFTIYDGPNNTSPVLYSDCSSYYSRPSNTILSTSNRVLLSLDSGSRNLYFTATYHQICSQNFTTSSGVFSSPNYPNNYDHGTWCFWNIAVPFNRKVALTIQNFQLAVTNGSCGNTSDRIIISPVGGRSYPVVILNGAGQSPAVYTSPGNVMTVALMMNKFSPGAMGFNASFVATCGETLIARSTPGYLNMAYTMDDTPVNCEWTITNGLGSSMTIANVMFVDVPDSQNCTTDYVEVRYEETSRRVCGRQGSNVSISTAGNITVIYHQTSSFNGSYGGFGLMYTTREQSCTRTLTASRGVITSPNYPEEYPNNKLCQWTINAPEGQRIRLTFETFALEYQSSCIYDVVRLHNGNSTHSARISGNLCGLSSPRPATYTSTSNSMLVYFKTDGSVTKMGFKANYFFGRWTTPQPPPTTTRRTTTRAPTTGCGGTLTANRGVITSPNYPGNYPNSITCRWFINAHAGTRIQLTFETFNLEGPSSRCPYDAVQLHNGNSIQSTTITRKLCDGRMPSPATYTSRSNSMLVYFKTDGSITRTGFRAIYTVQGHTNTSRTTTYPPWSRWPTTGHTNTSRTTTYPPWSRWPTTVFNTGHTYTSRRTTYSPWSTWRTTAWRTPPQTSSTTTRAPQSCGGTLTAHRGVITSPNYPGNYTNSIICRWFINAHAGTRIQLTFETFDLEGSSCRYDYVQLHNGNSIQSAMITRKLCDRTTPSPATYTSRSNSMLVYFKTDGSITGTGFRAIYTVQGPNNTTGPNYTTGSHAYTTRSHTNNSTGNSRSSSGHIYTSRRTTYPPWSSRRTTGHSGTSWTSWVTSSRPRGSSGSTRHTWTSWATTSSRPNTHRGSSGTTGHTWTSWATTPARPTTPWGSSSTTRRRTGTASSTTLPPLK